MRAIPLYVWTGFNLLLALGILASILVFHRDPPALSILFDESRRRALAPDVRATVTALAVLANALIFAFSALILVLVHARAHRVAVAGALVTVQLFGFASDAFLGNRNLVANLISSGVLGLGLVLAPRR